MTIKNNVLLTELLQWSDRSYVKKTKTEKRNNKGTNDWLNKIFTLSSVIAAQNYLQLKYTTPKVKLFFHNLLLSDSEEECHKDIKVSVTLPIMCDWNVWKITKSWSTDCWTYLQYRVVSHTMARCTNCAKCFCW